MTTASRAAIDQDLARLRDAIASLRQDLEAALALAAGPRVDGMFQPGHTYALFHARYLCEHLTTHPTTGELIAWGWATDNADIQHPWWTHRPMTTADFTRWKTEGATDLTPQTEGEPR